MKSNSVVADLFHKVKNAVKEARATWRRASIARRLSMREVSCEPAIVVAPHPDDETFGAGGLIALKRAMDVPVTVILLTDGGASLSGFPQIPSEEVGRARRNQAIAAVRCLGLDSENVISLGLVDGKIPHEGQPGFEDAVARLASELDRRTCREIYLPHPHDGLPDHEAAAGIVLAAARGPGSPYRIILYTVWAWFNAQSPLRDRLDPDAGWRLDIRPVYAQKQAAVAQYVNGDRAPGGQPYCGSLPRALTRSAMARDEIFFDHATENLGPCMAARQTGTSA